MQLLDADARSAFAAARDLCRRETPAAYRAAFFLPREKRDAVYAVCAFSTLMRRAIDAGGEGEQCCGGGEGVVAVVKSRIDVLYAEQVELPLPQFRDASQWTFAAMADVVKRYEIPRQYLHDFIEGLSADRSIKRYATWKALEKHCTKVGGSAAKAAACVLGATHSDGAAFATRIGVASRLVSILRNLSRDLAHDRIYLPLEDFAKNKCTERELIARTMTDRIRDLIRFEVTRARDLIRDGAEGLCWLDGDGSRMAAATFVASLTGQLDAIERAGFDPFAPESRISTGRKLRQLSMAWRLARRAHDEPLPRVG